ncbi:MAG TPA: hypothetical protein VFB72_14365, partial [Verrucomicrobiae bacterium]|nr:hypothetical protein [Verrucomicrobiae bacterium]
DARGGAVDVHFATPMAIVKIDARPVAPPEFTTLTLRPYLQGFDSNNNYLGTVYYSGPLPTNSSQVGDVETLVFSSSTTNIAYARFSSQNPGTNDVDPSYAMFDNLRYGNGMYNLNLTVVDSGGATGFVIESPYPFGGGYSYGTVVNLDAWWLGGSAYTFVGYSGDINTTQNPYNVLIDSDKNITATFVHIPQLHIAPTTNSNVLIWWPTNDVGFTLESIPRLLTAATWSIQTTHPIIVGTNYTVTDANKGTKFYRLAYAGQVPIPGLFNTGVGTNGALLASNTVDPHWKLIQSADPSFPGPNAIVVDDAPPIPPWITNGPASKWLAPQANQAGGNQPGNYTYRITFDLTGLEKSTAVVSGHWTSDNTGKIVLNGTATAAVSDGNFAALTNAFTFLSGFVSGTNTLDFVVTNAGTAINPTGVRVEVSGTANRLITP